MAVPARPVEGSPVDVAWGGVVHDVVGAYDVQAGASNLVWSGAAGPSNATPITFPRAFASQPVVVVSMGVNGANIFIGLTGAPLASGFTVQGRHYANTTQSAQNMPFHWIAYGPRA